MRMCSVIDVKGSVFIWQVGRKGEIGIVRMMFDKLSSFGCTI
jgi:hypothetical protein